MYIIKGAKDLDLSKSKDANKSKQDKAKADAPFREIVKLDASDSNKSGKEHIQFTIR